MSIQYRPSGPVELAAPGKSADWDECHAGIGRRRRSRSWALRDAARSGQNQLSRLHGVWGIGQLARQNATLLPDVAGLLGDADAEVRAQAARVLGDARHAASAPALRKLLGDPSPRPRFFAAIALGRIGDEGAEAGLLAMLRANGNEDAFLRHAGVMGLVGCSDEARLRALAKDDSTAVRLAAVVALRRLKSPAVADFLADADASVVTEAARAINDATLSAAMPQLAKLVEKPGLPEPTLRRALNANLRAGGADRAGALAQFAKSSSAEPRHRAEAVTLLGKWPAPSGRDQVTGLWRPLPGRDAGAAAEAQAALDGVFNDLLAGPAEVQVAAAEAAGRVGLASAAAPLAALARDMAADAKVRTAALRALAALNAPQFGDLVAAAVKDGNEAVRREALRLQGGVTGRDALATLRAALEKGSTGEQQAAFESLAKLPGEGTDKLLLAWLGQLREGRVPAAIQLDLIEAAGQRGEAVQKALGDWEASLPADDLARRKFLLAGGDATAGRKVFHEKEALACLRCHKVGDEGGGVGGDVGPNLSNVGVTRTREQILEAIIHPNKDIAAGFENLLIMLEDGTPVAGMVKSETDTELVINSPEDGPMTLKKAGIKSRERGLSGMPEGLEAQMTRREFRDLLEYLAEQKSAPTAAVGGTH